MQKQFKQFSENIRLTTAQEEDAQTKYNGICEKLHSSYYTTDYDGSTKLLFGSYKNKTSIRPMSEKHDVDVLFKIPKEIFEKFKNYTSNGPSALLQEVRGYLNEKYSTTEEIKAWGKVVLVKFAHNAHNVEVLPAYEEEDGTFTIPNSENGGSWDKFDPRAQLETFRYSNTTTNGLTADLARMIKTWVDNTSSLNYGSYHSLLDVISFLENNYKKGAEFSEYSAVLKDFFSYLKNSCNSSIENAVDTALSRAKKARDFEIENKHIEASEEWRKIFGFDGKSDFPLATENPVTENNTRVFSNPSMPYANIKIK